MATTIPSIQNNFIGGLKTEFTGLDFPENACTDADNTIFTLTGDTIRREGFNFELNATGSAIDRTGKAISSYKWNNVGGDGSTQVIVEQIGSNLYFYRSSSATIAAPLSTTSLGAPISISTFLATGSGADPSITECQYTDGNGYLFVFHPNCDPFYVTYSAGAVSANIINIKIRDFVGIAEPGVADNYRPLTLSADHHYNLYNQGWQAGAGWSAVSPTSVLIKTALFPYNATFQVASGLTISPGDGVVITPVDPSVPTVTGPVVSYSGTSLTITLTSASFAYTQAYNNWSLVHSSDTLINTWFTGAGGGPAQNNYPSNADVWWNFKDSTGKFNTTTVANVTLNQGPAPKGYFALSAFNIDRSQVSSIPGLTPVSTTARPKTGTWFQGRVWYGGVDASFSASGDAPFSTWTENIYFSQVVTATAQFAKCHQVNDPTSETLFALLPTDGGVITIQGSGSIYKLFPIQTGMFVFAANGVWYISGSAGIGFSANDYTITKVSGIQSTSGTSFINVSGWPFFWNEEGIYEVVPSGTADTQNNRRNFFQVNNLTIGTILTFYQNIPIQSKKFARGDYHPLDYVLQWCYRDSNESSVTDRYQFNRILNYNTATKAFYTYTIQTTNGAYIHGINYVAGPGGSTSPAPVFKYITSYTAAPYNFTFSEERDLNYVDWAGLSNTSYTSFFITGYSLKGQAISKFQVPYAYVYSRNPSENEYIIQSIWDYAGTGNSGRWSTRQIIDNNNSNFTMLYRRHRLRGRGLAVQIKFSSVTGKPYDIMGWALYNSINQGI